MVESPLKKKPDKYDYLKYAKKKKSKKQHREEVVDEELDENVELAYKMLERKKKTKKNYRIDGKIQSTSKGFAFLIPTDPSQTDVYISEKNLNRIGIRTVKLSKKLLLKLSMNLRVFMPMLR